MTTPKKRPVITLDRAYEGHETLAISLALTILSLFLGCTMIASNILATKIWGCTWVTLDGGFLLFPLTYVIGDVLVELFHRKIANKIAIVCAAINVVVYIAFKLSDLLPDAPGVSNIALSAALGLSSPIIIGSTAAFIVSQMINNKVYDEMRDYTDPDKQIWVRAWFSSLVSRFFDTVIFTVIAFWGRLGLFAMLRQGACAFIAGMIVETLLTPVTSKLARALRNALEPRGDDSDEDDEDEED